MFYINVVLAAIGGAFVTLSMIINAKLGEKIGGFQGTLINYITGLIVATLFAVVLKLTGHLGHITTLSNIPFVAFLGGLMGVMVIVLSNKVIPKIPAIYSMVLIFIGQLVMGMLIDYFSFNIFSIGKFIGALLIIVGVVYNFNLDKKVAENTKISVEN